MVYCGRAAFARLAAVGPRQAILLLVVLNSEGPSWEATATPAIFLSVFHFQIVSSRRSPLGDPGGNYCLSDSRPTFLQTWGRIA